MTLVASIAVALGGAAFMILGFLGCVVPAIPGPILAYLSLHLLSIPTGWTLFHPVTLIVLGVVAVAATVLDNIFPALASKKAGAGRPGVWGSVVGMIFGSIFFPPFGVFIGAFLGALLGEVLLNPENKGPLKAAAGVFRGTLLGILVKLGATGVVAFYYLRGAIRLFSWS
ncbi:MAG: DUF456 domain-containing protein [Spirochaetota bacterium]